MPTPRPRAEQPNAQQRNQMVQRLVAMGYRGQDLAEIVVAGRTRGQMATGLIALQREAGPRT